MIGRVRDRGRAAGLGGQMNVVRIGFFASLAVWLVGGLITHEYGTEVKRLEIMLYGMTSQDSMMMNLRGISKNLFGPLAIALGLVLAGVWIFRRVSSSAADVESALASAPVSPLAARPQAKVPIPQSSEAQPLGCAFSGWTLDGKRIFQEYDFVGQGIAHKLAVEITVEQGTISLLRFVNFSLMPSIGYSGQAEVRLLDENTGKSPGWMKVRVASAAGNATVINIPERRAADAAFEMFSAPGDFVFTLRQAGEEVLSLPLPNEGGLLERYDVLRRELKVGTS